MTHECGRPSKSPSPSLLKISVTLKKKLGGLGLPFLPPFRRLFLVGVGQGSVSTAVEGAGSGPVRGVGDATASLVWEVAGVVIVVETLDDEAGSVDDGFSGDEVA